MAGCLDCNAVMADAGRFSHQTYRQIRIIGAGHGDRIDENLCSDLLRQRGSIGPDRSALRRIHAVLQIQISRVLG